MDNHEYEATIRDLRRENADLGWRLTLAQSCYDMVLKAYDALLSYRIDYRTLRTYSLWEKLLPQGATFDNPAARSAITNWISRVRHDIDAAIRRKTNIKLAHEQAPDPENGI